MTTDWQDWQPHPHMALAQYTQGIPLARKPTGVGNASNTVAGGATVDLADMQVITQPSFQMLVGLSLPLGAGTVPFGRLRFTWVDTASGFTVDPDWIDLPAGNNALNFAYIVGPSLADQLTIDLDNLDPAITVSYSFGISQTSHVFDRLRVEEVGQVAVTGFTRAVQQGQLACVGSVSTTIPISSTIDRLCSTWAGPAILSVDNSAGTVPVIVQLLDPGVIAGGAPLYGVAHTGVIATMVVAAGAADSEYVALPNGPVVIREINNSAASTVAPSTTIIRLPV